MFKKKKWFKSVSQDDEVDTNFDKLKFSNVSTESPTTPELTPEVIEPITEKKEKEKLQRQSLNQDTVTIVTTEEFTDDFDDDFTECDTESEIDHPDIHKFLGFTNKKNINISTFELKDEEEEQENIES